MCPRERERERRASVCERERECARESECVRERERDSAREILYSYVKRVQRTSVARVGGFFPSQLGYFESTVAGKITEPWGCVFWATYIM